MCKIVRDFLNIYRPKCCVHHCWCVCMECEMKCCGTFIAIHHTTHNKSPPVIYFYTFRSSVWLIWRWPFCKRFFLNSFWLFIQKIKVPSFFRPKELIMFIQIYSSWMVNINFNTILCLKIGCNFNWIMQFLSEIAFDPFKKYFVNINKVFLQVH